MGNETDNMLETLHRRNMLVIRLIAALAHLPPDQRLSVTSSFIPLDKLQEIVEFQEGRIMKPIER